VSKTLTKREFCEEFNKVYYGIYGRPCMHRNTYLKYLYKQGYVSDYGIVGYVFNFNSPYGCIPGKTYIHGLMCNKCDELKTTYNCSDDHCNLYGDNYSHSSNKQITEYGYTEVS